MQQIFSKDMFYSSLKLQGTEHENNQVLQITCNKIDLINDDNSGIQENQDQLSEFE